MLDVGCHDLGKEVDDWLILVVRVFDVLPPDVVDPAPVRVCDCTVDLFGQDLDGAQSLPLRQPLRQLHGAWASSASALWLSQVSSSERRSMAPGHRQPRCYGYPKSLPWSVVNAFVGKMGNFLRRSSKWVSRKVMTTLSQLFRDALWHILALVHGGSSGLVRTSW